MACCSPVADSRDQRRVVAVVPEIDKPEVSAPVVLDIQEAQVAMLVS